MIRHIKNTVYNLKRILDFKLHWRKYVLWPYQRVFRGWDDRACWSVDIWLATNMVGILQQLKEVKQGIPAEFCYTKPYDIKNWPKWSDYEKACQIDDDKAMEAWNAIIDQMILAFKILEKDGWPIPLGSVSKDLKKVEEGLDLFRKYLGALWD